MRNALAIQAEHDAEMIDILTDAHARSISAPLLGKLRTLPVALTAWVRTPGRTEIAARIMGWHVVK